MRGKRQQTMAKMARERAVKERRALKQEKKQAAARAKAEAADGTPSTPVGDDEDAPFGTVSD
jgi:hypothetical protein